MYFPSKTKTDETNDVGSQGVSSVGDVPSHTPVWEERIMVELEKDKVLDEGNMTTRIDGDQGSNHGIDMNILHRRQRSNILAQ